MNREELIAALVTDKYSGFKDGDENILTGASDARLEEFRAAADARKTEATAHAQLETNHKNVSARLKVAEDRVKASEASMTEEEFIARAPEGIKRILEAVKADEAALKASYVSTLKDCGVSTEEDLKKMSIPELQERAKWARVKPLDYSGRGLPSRFEAAEDKEKEVDYAPPDAYGPGLEALRKQIH